MNYFISLIGMMGGQEGQKPTDMLIPMLLLIVVFYFFMIRPQVKKQKELKNFRAALGKGDKIITTGGIYGKITSATDTTFNVEIASGVIIKVDKNAVLKDSSDLQQAQPQK